MTDPVLVTLITTAGVVFVALVGVWVELIRTRKQQTKVVTEVTPNGGASMKDALGRIESDLREVRTEQSKQGARIATVNARFDDHLLIHRREG